MKFGTRSALTPAGWESMVALLDPLRLYDLSPESFVSRELMAYAAGLALFRQRLERCQDDLFLATCSLERLARWEELLDLPVARTDEASRREMAAVKLSIGEGDFTPEGIRRSLLAAGLEAELEEDFSQRLIPGHRCPDHRRLPDPGRSQGPGAPDAPRPSRGGV